MATRFLSLAEVLDLYSRVLLVGGGASAIRDLGALESALAQPRATFADEDLYPSLAEKASALGFSLILNHPFVDGNKRIGHAAVEVFLVLNGFELSAGIDDAERVIRCGGDNQSGRVHDVDPRISRRISGTVADRTGATERQLVQTAALG